MASVAKGVPYQKMLASATESLSCTASGILLRFSSRVGSHTVVAADRFHGFSLFRPDGQGRKRRPLWSEPRELLEDWVESLISGRIDREAEPFHGRGARCRIGFRR
jgi:hypothetical protein